MERGLKVTLPEFGLTSNIVFTSDTQLVGRFQDQARSRRQLAAEWSYDMAMYELEKVIYVQGQLRESLARVNDAQSLLEDGKQRLQKSKEFWEMGKFAAAYHEAQRRRSGPCAFSCGPTGKKPCAGWIRRSPAPMPSLSTPCPSTGPSWTRCSVRALAQRLAGGDFELGPERTEPSWRLDRPSLERDSVEMTAERVTELKGFKIAKVEPPAKANTPAQPNVPPPPPTEPPPTTPIEGKQCLKLEIRPRVVNVVPAALERSVVALTSRDVKLPPGSLVQISGWACVPAAITASPDGALMYDSAGGEPMAIRLTEAAPTWKKYTVYRRVPASGNIHVTLALTGVGSVYFDDIRIEPLVPPSTAAPGKSSGQ